MAVCVYFAPGVVTGCMSPVTDKTLFGGVTSHDCGVCRRPIGKIPTIHGWHPHIHTHTNACINAGTQHTMNECVSVTSHD
mmetsp:Transcript_9391/g.27070  ORF Transcript_9391/g.27070 Transcript_9391/m.27070 type:complete len:80 (-) Transcript_9391:142-381(-)